VNVGVFIAAALFLDALLWLFVLVGWESIILPSDIARTHQPDYVFPYSHGLVASLAWSAAAGAVAFAAYRRQGAARVRIALLVAAAVSSHWLLDALVHRPELPLVGSDSPKVGLGLWSSLPTALCIEVAILAIGFCLFVPGCRMSRGRWLAFTVLSLVIAVATVAGMTIAPPPPSPEAMAVSSGVTIVLVCALAGWLARLPREGRA
jgi:hypothetical protein